MARAHPSPDESLRRLHAAGWSVGETGTASGWVVSGQNGENVIEARGATQSEAWHRACEQAEALGMLGRRDRAETTQGRLTWAQWAGPVPPRTPPARPSPPAGKPHWGTLLALLGAAALLVGGILLDPAAGLHVEAGEPGLLFPSEADAPFEPFVWKGEEGKHERLVWRRPFLYAVYPLSNRRRRDGHDDRARHQLAPHGGGGQAAS
jgi:hypothetical protein